MRGSVVPLPFVGMVMVVLAQVSNMVLTKVALSKGTNKYILATYANAFSTLILLPICFFSHRLIGRSGELPPLTFSILCRIILLALCGCTGQISGYAGIQYSSPTLGTAMLNLIPAFTFILAIIFRMEKVDWRSSGTQVKFVGTLVSIAGAFVVTFYKGPSVITTHSLLDSVYQLSPRSSWVLGALFLAIESFMYSAWYIVQALILKLYPAVFIVTFYLYLFATIMAANVSLIAVNDPSDWILRLDMGLIAILYSAIVSNVFRVSLLSWCLWMTGPLYVSMFKPLAIIFAVVMGVIFIGDALSLGSLIGAVVIVSGFYAVMWGKVKEEEIGNDSGVGSLESSSENVPLLQNKREDV